MADDWKNAPIVSDWETAEVVEPPEQGTNPFLVHPVAKFAAGSYLGLKNAITGAKQLGNALDFRASDAERESRAAELKSEIAARDLMIGKTGMLGQAGAMVGEALPSMAVPGGPAGGIVRRVAGGIAADTLASAADPVREGETREGNLTRAATFSGGIRSVGGAAGKIGGKIVDRFANAKAGEFAEDSAKELVDIGRREGVSVFYDDITDSALAKRASQAVEIFGKAGTGSGRARQNDEALQAANRWLQRVSGDTDDYAEIVQSGLKRKLNVFKKEASKRYARVAREIGPDAGQVTTRSFDTAAQKAIADETAKGTRANPAVVDFINKFKDAPRGDFDEMIEFRSDLLSQVRSLTASPDNNLGKTSIDSLMRLQEALDDDLSRFAGAHGAEGYWRDANQFYKNTVVQFRIGKLKNLVNEKSAANFDDQAAWNYLAASSTNPKRARLMWQALDAKGRSAVRGGLIAEAVDAATPTGKPFSPAKFAGYLEKRSPVTEQFFRGRSGEEIGGLVKLMRHIERAGQYAENPPTGQRAIPWLVAGGAYFEPTTAASAVGVSASIKGLFQTEAGRNLLLAANKATPGSKQFDNIVMQIEKVASRTSN